MCGSEGTIGGDWQVRAREQVEEQRRIAKIAQRERKRLQSAIKVAQGMPDDGIAPGTRWEDVPETWSCPDCAANKADFEMVEI